MTDQLAVGLYRSTAAAYKDGKVTVAYAKEDGQSCNVILERTTDCTVELGGEYVLVLRPVEEAVPLPLPVVPEFPEFPTPELPAGVMPPIGTLPPVGVTPGLPAGVMPPIHIHIPPVTLPAPVDPAPPAGITPEIPPAGQTKPTPQPQPQPK